MELYRSTPPAALGIPSKLLPRDPESLGASAYPYRAAAQELGLLVLESCPQKKLECIGEGCREEGAGAASDLSQRGPWSSCCASSGSRGGLCLGTAPVEWGVFCGA